MIELSGTGELTAPIVIAAFEGWNDAGEAASGAVSQLATAWQAAPAGAIDPEDYYDFQVTRPVTEVVEGKSSQLIWPTTRLLTTKQDRIDRDLILVQGIEPNMRWRRFCAELVESFSGLGAEMVVLLGALLADSPHTRPVPVTASASDPSLAANLNASASDYKGPTGIVGVLQHACAEAGIPAVSLWAAVPHYVAQAPSPKATLALYVRTLEEAKDATELPEASGDAIAAEFERYLRRRRDHGERGGR